MILLYIQHKAGNKHISPANKEDIYSFRVVFTSLSAKAKLAKIIIKSLTLKSIVYM
nr:MAG TPA: hypothetical protein [Caudoviricetes sp.]